MGLSELVDEPHPLLCVVVLLCLEPVWKGLVRRNVGGLNQLMGGKGLHGQFRQLTQSLIGFLPAAEVIINESLDFNRPSERLVYQPMVPVQHGHHRGFSLIERFVVRRADEYVSEVRIGRGLGLELGLEVNKIRARVGGKGHARSPMTGPYPATHGHRGTRDLPGPLGLAVSTLPDSRGFILTGFLQPV